MACSSDSNDVDNLLMKWICLEGLRFAHRRLDANAPASAGAERLAEPALYSSAVAGLLGRAPQLAQGLERGGAGSICQGFVSW